MANPHTCYTYRTGEVYRYSVRAGNNHSNSIENGKYASRTGRNLRVNKLRKLYPGLKVVQGKPIK